MKVITIKQPWATLLVKGIKLDETRSWSTTVRGDILIHAANSWDKAGNDLYWKVKTKYNLPDPDDLPFGQIIGKIEIVDCLPVEKYKLTERFTPEQYELGDFRPNRFVWICKNHSELPAYIPAKGKLRFWDYE